MLELFTIDSWYDLSNGVMNGQSILEWLLVAEPVKVQITKNFDVFPTLGTSDGSAHDKD